MLHYIVTGVLKKTGFASGLYDDAELQRFGVPTPQQSEFIDRIHAVLAICVGESLGARVNALFCACFPIRFLRSFYRLTAGIDP